MAELTDTDIRDQVRQRYAAAATAVATNTSSVEIRDTHRVHQHAGSAIVRARKPA